METDRLLLKPLNKSYLSQNYVDWMNDSEVNRYLESGGNYNLNKLNEYLMEVERNPKYFWAIILKEINKHIGNIKIDPIDPDEFFGEYGIMLGDRNEWGKGIAKEASEKVINFCFNTLNLKKISLGVKKNNFSAISLYKKLGFAIEHSSILNRTNQEHNRMFISKPN